MDDSAADSGAGGASPAPAPETLSGREFTYEVTELILHADDEITSAQALAIRLALDGFARSRGWVFDQPGK